MCAKMFEQNHNEIQEENALRAVSGMLSRAKIEESIEHDSSSNNERDLTEVLEEYKQYFDTKNYQKMGELLQSDKARKVEKTVRKEFVFLLENMKYWREKDSQNGYDWKFDQIVYINKLNSYEHPQLDKLVKRYFGLCDLICNYMTVNKQFDVAEKGFLDELEERYARTHIIKQATFLQIILAMIFKIYPNALLSRKDNKQIYKNQMLNKELFLKALDALPSGHDAKFGAFGKKCFWFTNGHSTLIRKNADDNYIFFDPNNGATKPMTKDECYQHVKVWLNENNKLLGNDSFKEVCLMNNTAYLNKILNLDQQLNSSLKLT